MLVKEQLIYLKISHIRSGRTKTVHGSHCCAGARTMLAERNRSGTQTIVKGKGQLLINDKTRTIKEVESVVIKKDDKHAILKQIETSKIIDLNSPLFGYYKELSKSVDLKITNSDYLYGYYQSL